MEYSTVLKSLSQTNLNKIRTVFEEIDDEFQIKQSPKIIIPFLPPHCRPRPAKERITPERTEYEGIEIKKRTDGLNFLKNQGIIERYNVDSFHHRQDGNTEWHIEIKLNAGNFLNFKSSLENFANKPEDNVNKTKEQGTVTQVKENDKKTLTKNLKKCSICCKALAQIDRKNKFLLNCYICGVYELYNEAHRYIESLSFKDFWDNGHILSAIVREYSDMGTPITIKSEEDVERLINSDMVPKDGDIQGQKDKILLALERKYHHFKVFGAEINLLWDRDYPIGYCENPEELQYVLELLGQDGFIKATSITPPPVVGTYKIQSSGWDRLKELNGEKIQTKKQETIPVKFSTPLNTKWEDITIKFRDGHNVDIKIKDKTIRSDFREMGFEDKKRRLPNKQWIFLKTLAENNGEISWSDSKATLKLKKRKQLLSDTLKAYFQIDEDPFLPYKQEKAYKIRVNLIPE